MFCFFFFLIIIPVCIWLFTPVPFPLLFPPPSLELRKEYVCCILLACLSEFGAWVLFIAKKRNPGLGDKHVWIWRGGKKRHGVKRINPCGYYLRKHKEVGWVKKTLLLLHCCPQKCRCSWVVNSPRRSPLQQFPLICQKLNSVVAAQSPETQGKKKSSWLHFARECVLTLFGCYTTSSGLSTVATTPKLLLVQQLQRLGELVCSSSVSIVLLPRPQAFEAMKAK